MNNLKFAVVCSNNQNRSMETHYQMERLGFNVRSFGTGKEVRLPGSAANRPNVFSFDTTYDGMYRKLLLKDKYLYTQNGILNMLERNSRIKPKPERFQDCLDSFDIVFTVEEKIFDTVLETQRSCEDKLVQGYGHIINIPVEDSHEAAVTGANQICEIADRIRNCTDIDDQIYEIISEFEAKFEKPMLHSIMFY